MSGQIGIGVDIGGTYTKLGLVRANGTLLQKSSIDTGDADGPDALLHRIGDAVTQLIDGLEERPVAIGLGVPGVINDRGEIAWPPNLPGWTIVPVAEKLRPYLPFDIPIFVENDANVAALAEARAGAGRDLRNFLFITLGTGIGGCVIIDGHIWRGGGGGAGEVGHVSIDANGPLCGCGSRGCIETYLGQKHMSDLAVTRASREDGMLADALKSGREISPRTIVDAAQNGDRVATQLLAELGELLGAALASVLNLCDLTTVVVGGGVSGAGDLLLESARLSLRRRALKSIAARTEIRQATLGNDAGIIGAALLGKE